MALDATIGGAASNSYGTLAAADTYFADRMYSEVWTSAADPLKTSALITATMRLEELDYRGERATTTQALKHPRIGLPVDGIDVPSNAIAVPVIRAEFEYAIELLKADVSSSSGAGQLEQFKSLKIGPLSLEMNHPPASDDFEALMAKALAGLPLKVFLLLKDLVVEGGGMESRPTTFTLAEGCRGRY